MAEARTQVPMLVRDSLEREGAYDFGLGVVLRSPTDPGGGGGSASYRIDHRTEPLLPGRPAPQRRQLYSRDLEAAYARASEKFQEMQQRAGGTYIEYHTDVPFGEVAEPAATALKVLSIAVDAFGHEYIHARRAHLVGERYWIDRGHCSDGNGVGVTSQAARTRSADHGAIADRRRPSDP